MSSGSFDETPNAESNLLWSRDSNDPSVPNTSGIELNNGNFEWDDSELVAHYDRVDAFVKRKIHALYAQQKAANLPSANPSQRGAKSNNPKQASASTTTRLLENSPMGPRFVQSGPRSQTVRTKNRVPEHSPTRSVHASVNRPPPPTATLPCDFEWLPPMLYPPEELFQAYPSSSHFPPPQTVKPFSHSACSDNQSTLPSFPLSGRSTQIGKPLKDLEHILHSWFESGYNMGREHALQVKKQRAQF